MATVLNTFIDEGIISFKEVKSFELISSILWGAFNGFAGTFFKKLFKKRIATAISTLVGTLSTGGTILEAVILTIIMTVLTNAGGVGNQINKLSKNRVKKVMKKLAKVTKSKLLVFAKAVVKCLMKHFKTQKTLYKAFFKELMSSNLKTWLISSGLGRLVS